jgi:Resolvase, N terminal domain
MEQSQAGAFDVLIVEALDRLSRDMEDLAGIHKRLTFRDIEIRAVHDGIADTVTIGLRGLVGQLYREDGAKKVRRGMAAVVRDARHAGGRAYAIGQSKASVENSLSSTPKPRSCGAFLSNGMPAARPVTSRTTLTATTLRRRAASAGTPRPFMATPPATTASYATPSTPARLSGIGYAWSKIPTPVGACRGRIRAPNGKRSPYPSWRSSMAQHSMLRKRGLQNASALHLSTSAGRGIYSRGFCVAQAAAAGCRPSALIARAANSCAARALAKAAIARTRRPSISRLLSVQCSKRCAPNSATPVSSRNMLRTYQDEPSLDEHGQA